MADTKVIEGSISSDGNILDGVGFTVTHLGPGAYQVTFTESFYYQDPQITKFEVLGAEEGSYGFKAEIIGKISKTGFKYFTFQVLPTNLIMMDLEIEYFHIWGFKKPLPNCNCRNSRNYR